MSHSQELEDDKKLTDLEIPGIDKGEDDVIALYEDAVKIGDTLLNVDGPSPCEKRYHKCPVMFDEILGYIGMMQSIDDVLHF